MAIIQIAYYQNGWKTAQRRNIEAATRFAQKIKKVSERIQIEEYRRMPGGNVFAWYPTIKI